MQITIYRNGNHNIGTGFSCDSHRDQADNTTIGEELIFCFQRLYGPGHRATCHDRLPQGPPGKDNLLTADKVCGYGSKGNLCVFNFYVRYEEIDHGPEIIC